MNLDLVLAIKILLLSLAANGAPVLGKRLLGERWAVPLDGGISFLDGKPLLGRSKTLRGLLMSLLTTALVAMLFGFGWQVGLLYAAMTMAGDSFSSFIKRRLGIAPSGKFRGLDQLPEAALPMWICRTPLGITNWDVAALVGLFFAGDFVLSKLMFRLGIRERPY